ncbi:uncharacterized protein METZ01_LOCUS150849 [marine metagenome]|uniref:Uncharacterized protein n=1 Tax=marine metagenome TaxID=408172 RepID=A0A382A8X3_9ZZZZ
MQQQAKPGKPCVLNLVELTIALRLRLGLTT